MLFEKIHLLLESVWQGNIIAVVSAKVFSFGFPDQLVAGIANPLVPGISENPYSWIFVGGNYFEGIIGAAILADE
jgi:hypothetical protein